MLEDCSHSCRKVRLLPSGQGVHKHDILQPRGETRAGWRVGDTARSEHTVMAPRQGSPALSPAPKCTCALVAVAKASASCFTWRYKQPSGGNLSIILWHWGHKLRAAAQLQGLGLLSPTRHNVQTVHFDQMRDEILLTTSNNHCCYYRTMFTEEHLNCSIDKMELS